MKNEVTRRPVTLARIVERTVAFWNLVDRSGGPDACWFWLGKCTPINPRYPNYTLPRYSGGQVFGDRKSTHAYRIAHILCKGPIPKGMTVDHLCFNPNCCNPAHLRLLTPGENARRKDPRKKLGGELYKERVFANGSRRGTHCKRGHERTPDSLYRDGRCKACVKIRDAQYYITKKQARTA